MALNPIALNSQTADTQDSVKQGTSRAADERPAKPRIVPTPGPDATQMGDFPPTVTVSAGVLHIVDFVDTDPDVVSSVSTADDAEAATHSLLRIGAQAVRLASADLDADVVQRRFDAMAVAFDATVGKAVNSVDEAAGELLDPEHGSLVLALATLRSELGKLLGETFDASSKTSAITKIEQAFATTSDQLLRNVRATFSLDQVDSPLARTKAAMVDAVKDQVGTVMTELREISKALAAGAVAAEMSAKLTSKGVAFEELITTHIEPFASVHADIIEPVGRAMGAGGTLKGDILVTVCPDDTAGKTTRFVIEAKDQKLSMTKALAELDAVLANHDAAAAVIIFASQAQAPIGVPFWYSGDRAVLVFDKVDPDPRSLRLAYEWARWVCRRQSRDTDTRAIDTDEVLAALDRARRALKRHQTIKICHSAIKAKADEAGMHVSALVGDVDQAIDELAALMREAPRKIA